MVVERARYERRRDDASRQRQPRPVPRSSSERGTSDVETTRADSGSRGPFHGRRASEVRATSRRREPTAAAAARSTVVERARDERCRDDASRQRQPRPVPWSTSDVETKQADSGGRGLSMVVERARDERRRDVGSRQCCRAASRRRLRLAASARSTTVWVGDPFGGSVSGVVRAPSPATVATISMVVERARDERRRDVGSRQRRPRPFHGRRASEERATSRRREPTVSPRRVSTSPSPSGFGSLDDRGVSARSTGVGFRPRLRDRVGRRPFGGSRCAGWSSRRPPG